MYVHVQEKHCKVTQKLLTMLGNKKFTPSVPISLRIIYIKNHRKLRSLTFLVPFSFPTPGTVKQGLVRQSRIFSPSTGLADA
jgi:hypothetical protein